jgi:hypothetical protein
LAPTILAPTNFRVLYFLFFCYFLLVIFYFLVYFKALKLLVSLLALSDAFWCFQVLLRCFLVPLWCFWVFLLGGLGG